MPIPADYTLKAGHYKRDDDPNGKVVYVCSCPGAKVTLKQLAKERHLWTPWPAKPVEKKQ